MSNYAMDHAPESPSETAKIFHIRDKSRGNSEELSPEFRQQLAYTQATEILFTDLIIHHSSIRGLELAEEISKALSPPLNDDSETTRLHVALMELVRAEEDNDSVNYEDQYDQKYESDLVFRSTVDLVKNNLNFRRMEQRRKAARKLLELRMLSPEDVTDRDPEWVVVVDRLFS